MLLHFYTQGCSIMGIGLAARRMHLHLELGLTAVFSVRIFIVKDEKGSRQKQNLGSFVLTSPKQPIPFIHTCYINVNKIVKNLIHILGLKTTHLLCFILKSWEPYPSKYSFGFDPLTLSMGSTHVIIDRPWTKIVLFHYNHSKAICFNVQFCCVILPCFFL